MAKIEKKVILSQQPLALHEIERSGWRYQKIETFGAFDIQDALSIVLRRLLLADPRLLKKMDKQDDIDFTESSHRARRYISKHLEEIYLNKDESFAKKHSIELYGYWFPTNIGFKELSAIFRLACCAAKIECSIRRSMKDLINI